MHWEVRSAAEKQRAGHAGPKARRQAGEVQFLAPATRGQAFTASGLEDGPVGDWLVVAVGGAKTKMGGGCSPSGSPWLLTPDFGMKFFLAPDFPTFWC